MTVSKADAQQALDDIRRTEFRGKAARSYRASSNVLLLWGAIWAVAYTANGLLPPPDWWMAWVPANVLGIAASTWLYWRRSEPGNGQAVAWIALGAACFMVSLYVVAPPRTAPQGQALPALVVALFYVVLGARMPRFALVGVALFAATLVGFVFLPAVLPFWMAAVGGGALILGGLWLRSA